MPESLEVIQEGFISSNPRLAVFDREIREDLGCWKLSEAIPVEEIISEFASHGGFVHNERVVIPLHAPDERQPTGEYIEYRPNDIVQSLVYYEFGSGKKARIPLEEFGESFPARRIRLWDSYLPTTSQTDGNKNGNTNKSTLFDDLHGFLESAREYQRDQARSEFKLSRNSVGSSEESRYPLADNLGFDSGRRTSNLLRLRFEEECDIQEEYGLFEGNEILIGTDAEISGFPVEGEIVECNNSEIHVEIYWHRIQSSPPEQVFDPERGERVFYVGNLLNPVPFDRQEAAISALRAQDEKAEILTGDGRISFKTDIDVPISDHNLNNSQFSAAMNAIRSQSVYCIHGPPGTGKTRTLVEIIRGLAIRNNRILVCTHSNQAIDNLLVGDSTETSEDYSSLHAYIDGDEISAARIGRNSTNSIVRDTYTQKDPYSVDVVCGTTNSVHRFGDNIFDVAIIDEASQASIPSSILPLTKAKKLILAGDHKQLPPYYSGELDESEKMQSSLFERLIQDYGSNVYTTLKTQYRMNEEIFRFSNTYFYQSAVSHGDKNRSRQLLDLPPLEAYQIRGDEKTTPTSSYYNPSEITVVLNRLSSMIAERIKPDRIGIITPYTGQRKKIRQAIHEHFEAENIEGLKVDTIDSFQGSERDAIILSFVRSNPQNTTGFLTYPKEGPRRVNVALTRARKRCVIIGDFETLRVPTDEAVRSPERSDVFNELYRSLKERNLVNTLEPNQL